MKTKVSRILIYPVSAIFVIFVTMFWEALGADLKSATNTSISGIFGIIAVGVFIMSIVAGIIHNFIFKKGEDRFGKSSRLFDWGLLLIIIISIAGGTALQSFLAAAVYTPYTCNNYNFSVEFPGKKLEIIEIPSNQALGQNSGQQYSSILYKTQFLVMVTDYNSASEIMNIPQNQLKDMVVEGLKSNRGANIISVKDAVLDNIAGWRIRFSSDEQGQTRFDEMTTIFKGNREYSLDVIAPSEMIFDGIEVKRFYESFRLKTE